MGIMAVLNGSARGSGFLIAPAGNESFPVPLALKTTDGDKFVVELAVSAVCIRRRPQLGLIIRAASA
jgi:hypothetical protein